jgi:hypothetical protein
MPTSQRSSLIFDRNQGDETVRYQVYRGLKYPVSRQDRLIMTIEQPEDIHPISIEDDHLQRIGAGRYRSAHRNWIAESEVIKVNAAETEVAYSIDHATGVVTFEEIFEPADVVEASYDFDGIHVLDHTGQQPMAGVTFHGPYAYDQSPPTAPIDVTIEADDVNDRVVVRWEVAPSPGTIFYYRVEARDEDSRSSLLSVTRSGRLLDNLDGAPFQVEQSFDAGLTWEVLGRTHRPAWVTPYASWGTPVPAGNVGASATLDALSETGEVTMTWDLIVPGLIDSASYRISAISKNQFFSEVSQTVGPVEATNTIESIVIRRKISDGSFPTYGGGDAETVAELDGDAITFVDEDLADETVWAYSIYVLNAVGGVSTAATVLVSLGLSTDIEPEIDIEITQAL